MSLAAEQARLLTITARKSDCEFQSMNLSHQKIALSRDMENVSTTYQNALNTTKLVFDYYGSQTSQMDLTYGLLMTPSIYNDYYPKLVTDAKNRVVLNSAYAAAARAAGIPAEGLSGTPSSDVRNKFIEALAGQNIITPNKAATIQGITYGNTLGIGSTSNSTSATTEITYDELIDLITIKCKDSASWGMTMGTTADRAPDVDGNGSFERFCVAPDGNGIQQGAASQSVTLADLLNDKAQYNLSLESRTGEKTPIFETAYLQQKIVGESEKSPSFLNWMTEQFATVLGGTPASEAALQAAYNAVYDLVYPDSSIQECAKELSQGGYDKSDLVDITEMKNTLTWDHGNKNLEQHMNTVGSRLEKCEYPRDEYSPNVVNKSESYLGFVYSAGNKISKPFHPDRYDNSTVAINLNNLADVFLTAYVGAMKGPEENDYTSNVGKKSESNMYDSKNDDFKFTIQVDTNSDDGSSDTCLEASFYDTMFNRICLDGWTENNRIDDASYMQEMLKTGMVYISSISDDGFYYQGNYATDKNISEVPDEEAIAKAEAKYNTEKNKIENKEQKIDMKMKSLDTEIASLTTEYDTTKSVISKNIEKSFKRYDA